MTIHDIAKMAGVSIATVSRVLNGRGYVKDETRRRVEAVIDACGYRPNEAARTLIRSTSSMIAVIMSERPPSFSSKILEAIEDSADRQGDSVLFYNSGVETEREQNAISHAIEHKVKGILFLPVMDSGSQTVAMLKQAEQEDIPVVLLDWDLYEEAFDRVLLDNKKGIYGGAAMLLEEGHRRIAFVACPEVSKKGSRRKDGYLQCLKDWGTAADMQYLYEGDFSEQSGYEACQKFFALKEPPTAVLSACSSATLGCFRYFMEHRLHLRDDLELVGFDDISLIRFLGYPVTTLEQPVWELGECACDLLYRRINRAGTKKACRKQILGTKTIRRRNETGNYEVETEKEWRQEQHGK